jgi:hypothetical protein
MTGSHVRAPAATHSVSASNRLFRTRLWLASAMWLAVE